MSGLDGLTVAALVTDGFEQVELTRPLAALQKAGAVVRIVSEKSKVQGWEHHKPADSFNTDLTFEQADARQFGALLLPGGVMNADHIRTLPHARNLVREMDEAGKPVAVICHGAWLLVSAGLVQGRTLTSWPSLQDDIRNAGGAWVDREVVRDGHWVSSRKPDDIPAFNREMLALFSEALQHA